MNLTDSRLAQAGNEKLELAMLSFFEQFRKIYIGDQVQKSSKVQTLWALFSSHFCLWDLLLRVTTDSSSNSLQILVIRIVQMSHFNLSNLGRFTKEVRPLGP